LKTRFFKTIYGRISVIFLFLIVTFGGLQILLSVNSSVNYVCEATQKLNYHIASQLVQRCAPIIARGGAGPELRQSVIDLNSMNPHVAVYLLDSQGRVLEEFNAEKPLQRKRVDLAPIKAFLQKDSYHRLPIFGDDPLHKKRKKIFSVAELPMGESGHGYVYVLLASAKYDLSSEGLLGSYILRNSVLALGLLLLFAAILGSVLFFLITKRIHTMTHAVRLLEKGRYDQRIPINSDDEVSELAQAFNHMADTIEQNMRELEKNDRLRRELIANISHDLRSPLASIQGYVETVLMKGAKLSDEERSAFLETTLKNVIHLNDLVQELLELSKLDARQSRPAPEPFSISELVQDVMLKFQPQAKKRQIRLTSKLLRQLPMVFADIGMIERVLSNLIDNALRYTPPKGNVEVRLEERENSIAVSISDSGGGIPAQDLPYIFDRFYRVEKSRQRDSGGSGLGLAIVKKIIEAHGAEIKVESRPGQGTRFFFELPVFRRQEEVVSAAASGR